MFIYYDFLNPRITIILVFIFVICIFRLKKKKLHLNY